MGTEHTLVCSGPSIYSLTTFINMIRYLMIVFLCLVRTSAWCQERTNIHITDGKTGKPLEFVLVTSAGNWLATTDSAGAARLTLSAGTHRLLFVLTGYEKLDTLISVPVALPLRIALTQAEAELEEVTIVASTRTEQAIENSPLKVEVLGLEELGEEASIKPGNIASILGDVSGVQIQQSSATSGNSNVRIQGLDGRYTQILRDGMPLYDGFSGGFGILTVPPLDLQQVELIKGSASTLYGGGAIGGLINLISKRPKMEQELDALVNYSTLTEFNTNVYAAKRNKRLGYTLFAGYTRQGAVDVNKDGFSDVPDAQSIILHPRLFCYPTDKTMISAGYSGAFDDRKGGDMLVLNGKPDATHRFYEKNTSQRHTAEFIAEHTLKSSVKLTLKGNASNFIRETSSNTSTVNGEQLSYYSEISAYLPMRHHSLVAGVNVVGDNYTTTVPASALLKTYGNATVGAFAQHSLQLQEKTTIETGLRLDRHNRYGSFMLPRIAVFHRFSEHWASRAGFGMGYKTPNPLAPQNREYSVLDMLPLTDSVRPERSYGYNAEVNYKKDLGEHRSLFINQAFFLTRLTGPIVFEYDPLGRIRLVNSTYAIVSQGFDSYVKLALTGWELYLGYTITDARSTYPVANNFLRLTPRNRGAFVVAHEIGKQWRIGLEGSYTGSQYRYDRTWTPGYFFLAGMVQRNLGEHCIVVLNGENLLDYRMSRVEPLYTGSISAPTFKPLWAPIDGRVINLSVRWKL